MRCPSGDDYRRYEGFGSIRSAVFVSVYLEAGIMTSGEIMVNLACIVNAKLNHPQATSNPAATQRVLSSRDRQTRRRLLCPISPKPVQLDDWLKTPNPIAPRPLYCPSPSETATLGITWSLRTPAQRRGLKAAGEHEQEHDYEHERRSVNATHLRIMIRQFVC